MTEVAFGISLNGGQGARSVQSIAEENVSQQEEKYGNYRTMVYNNYGQRLKEFVHNARPADIETLDLLSYVDHDGLYIFRIINSQKEVKTKRIMFAK
jgi:hypothetical protein